MQKKLVAHAHIVCRHNKRHPVRDESNMAHERLIQNVVNGLPVVARTIRFACNFGSLRRCEVAHETRLAPASRSCKRQSGTGFSLCTFVFSRETDRQECLSHDRLAAADFAAGLASSPSQWPTGTATRREHPHQLQKVPSPSMSVASSHPRFA